MSKNPNHLATDTMIKAINDQMAMVEADYMCYVVLGRRYARHVMQDCGYAWPMEISIEAKRKCKVCHCPMLDEPALWLWRCPMCNLEVRREFVVIGMAGHAPMILFRDLEPETILIITGEIESRIT